jgi:anti-sigma factor RsiW
MVCRQVVEVVTDYLEGTMAARERARFEAHLAGCPHCREYLAQMRKTLEILGRIEPEELAPEAQDELVALYRRWRAD